MTSLAPMKAARIYISQRSLAFIVLISGILGGLLIVFSILFLCKYCLNRKNLREAEQIKLLYETLNQAQLIDGHRWQNLDLRDLSPLEPRRSNPIDRYQSPKNGSKKSISKPNASDYHSSGGPSSHNPSYYEMREHTGSKQQNSRIDDEQLYLQVDPRCYVRQNSHATLFPHRKSDTPRLEKGHSLNVDIRQSSSSSTSLSPYRQSSFDVPSTFHSQQQPSTPSPATSTQQDIYYTPRGSSLSVVANPIATTPSGSQHLSPPTPTTSRKNSAAIILEKKDLTATIDPSSCTSTVRTAVVQREHEHSRSLEHSSPSTDQALASNHTTNDKQSRSFDAVHLLRPGTNRSDVINRRTKSYENADDDRRLSTVSIAPPPIVIKIPDMTELVQAAQLSQLQNQRESVDVEEYQRTTGRKNTLVQQLSANDQNDADAMAASQELWRLRQSYELEEQQRLDRNSPEELSPDLLTSTSIDSANALPMNTKTSTSTTTTGGDDDPSRYQHRRKSSSNLLLPPPEVRRQALRRTFEKRRSCINQSNARREQQLDNPIDFNEENHVDPLTEFSSLLKHFNSKSENSSFERSLETDFDMQSDTSSRGPNDQFTSIESSGNENTIPDRRQSLQKPPSHQDDSGYKSLESQNSQNRTSSFDWMSADGGESVIYMGDNRLQQRSVDVKDLDEQLQQTEINTNRRSPKLLHTGLHRSYQETSTNLTPMLSPNVHMMQQRSLSTNIPVVDHDRPSPMNISALINTTINKIIPSSVSFTRTASKKRREFGKDKQHASVNVDSFPINVDEQQPSIHQVNETDNKSSSLLQVRRSDLRRSKSDATKNSTKKNANDSSTKDSQSSTHQTKSDNCLLSSSNAILLSTPPPNPIRQHLSPYLTPTNPSRPILQRSPSSTTPSVTVSPQVAAFRSQRSSVSFDHQTPLMNHSSSTMKTKISSTAHSVLPTFINKPRLKFSIVRDSSTTNSGHNPPVYSMPITRDYSIDERTNRIVNEFLMHDPSLDSNSGENSHRGTTKRHHHHHHRIRQRTFDETTTQKQSKSTGNKQRSHTNAQANMRRYSQHQYASVQLPESIEKDEDDSSGPTTPFLPSTSAAVRRQITMAAGSPSIIITGDDSGT